MKTEERIEVLQKKLDDITNEALSIIADAIKAHGNRVANFLESCDDIPAVFTSDTDDGIYTLDRVRLENDEVILEISNSYDCTEVSAADAPVQALINIAELIEDDDLYEEPEDWVDDDE